MQAGWEIILLDGSSEKHPLARQVGGDRVFFGDSRDMAWFIPTHERRSNNRGELLAALRVLLGKPPSKQTLIWPDSLLVVDGTLGKAQKWKWHRWVGLNGLVSHMDVSEEILSFLAVCGHEVHWLQVPSHIGIRGNHKVSRCGTPKITPPVWTYIGEYGGQGGQWGGGGEVPSAEAKGRRDTPHGIGGMHPSALS